MSIVELASATGVDRHVIGKLDRDEGHSPSYRTALRLSEALGVPVERLFYSEPIEASA